MSSNPNRLGQTEVFELSVLAGAPTFGLRQSAAALTHIVYPLV
jgi:hypothetical protein